MSFRWFFQMLRAAYRRAIASQVEGGPAIPDWVWIVQGSTPKPAAWAAFTARGYQWTRRDDLCVRLLPISTAARRARRAPLAGFRAPAFMACSVRKSNDCRITRDSR